MKKILFILLCFIASPVGAADWYVKKGATGTNAGTSWTNAWNEMDQIVWGSISAGDTIWVGGGTYSTSLTIGASGTSGSRIQVRRIRSTDAVCTSPCDASYDAQVIISADQGIKWNSGTGGTGSYVTIDGRVTSGIKTTGSDNEWGAGVFMDTGNDNVIIQYVEMNGPATETVEAHSADNSAFKAIIGSGRGSLTNLSIRYCIMQYACNLAKVAGQNLTFEHNTFAHNDTSTSATCHPNVLYSPGSSGTLIFRFNEVSDWGAEGILLDTAAQTWKVYGNIWRDKSTEGATNRIIEAQYYEHTVYFYNNTIDNVTYGILTGNGGSWSASSKSRNNIFYSSGTQTVTDSNYNAFSGSTKESNSIGSISSSVFTNYAGKDYSIVATTGASYPRDKGVALDSEYATDILGVSRPQGAAWDIGAYEYGGAAPSTATCTVGGEGNANISGPGTVTIQ